MERTTTADIYIKSKPLAVVEQILWKTSKRTPIYIANTSGTILAEGKNISNTKKFDKYLNCYVMELGVVDGYLTLYIKEGEE